MQRGGSEMPLVDLEVVRRETWVANQKKSSRLRVCTLLPCNGRVPCAVLLREKG